MFIATQAEHKYKYRIENSKNNKKKPTVPDRRTDKTREYKYKYTKKFKTTHYSNRQPNQSKREQVASFYLWSHCHQICSL